MHQDQQDHIETAQREYGVWIPGISINNRKLISPHFVPSPTYHDHNISPERLDQLEAEAKINHLEETLKKAWTDEEASKREALLNNRARSASKRDRMYRDEQRLFKQMAGRKRALPTDDPVETYCYCEQGSYGEMVACDNHACFREWVHLKCIGLESVPKSANWYCGTCAEALGLGGGKAATLAGYFVN